MFAQNRHFLAVRLRVKSNSCQDSITCKNRLFFASDRILVGIGRTHIATNTHASILPARASAYRVRLHWSWSRDWHAPCLHRPFLDRLNGSPGLPGHPCNRFFIVWIIDFIAPGQSSKNPKIQKWYLYGSFWYLTCYSLQLAKPLSARVILLPGSLDRVCIAHTA